MIRLPLGSIDANDLRLAESRKQDVPRKTVAAKGYQSPRFHVDDPLGHSKVRRDAFFLLLTAQNLELNRMKKLIGFQKIIINCLRRRSAVQFNTSDLDSITPKKRRVQHRDSDGIGSQRGDPTGSIFESPGRADRDAEPNRMRTPHQPDNINSAMGQISGPDSGSGTSSPFVTPTRPRGVRGAIPQPALSEGERGLPMSTATVEPSLHSSRSVALKTGDYAGIMPKSGPISTAEQDAQQINVPEAAADGSPAVPNSNEADCGEKMGNRPVASSTNHGENEGSKKSSTGKTATSSRVFSKYRESPLWAQPRPLTTAADFHDDVSTAAGTAIKALLQKYRHESTKHYSESSESSNYSDIWSACPKITDKSIYRAGSSAVAGMKERKLNEWRSHYSVEDGSETVRGVSTKLSAEHILSYSEAVIDNRNAPSIVPRKSPILEKELDIKGLIRVVNAKLMLYRPHDNDFPYHTNNVTIDDSDRAQKMMPT